MKREHTEDFWTKEIAFCLDGVSCVHKYNSADLARAPKGRIWRKDDEGLAFGCTAKGLHCGTGGRVAKFMVAITYREGVIHCEQYDNLNGACFKNLMSKNLNGCLGTPIRVGRSFLCKMAIPDRIQR